MDDVGLQHLFCLFLVVCLFLLLFFSFAYNIGKTVGILLTNIDTSGFTSNTLLIPKQDQLMIYILIWTIHSFYLCFQPKLNMSFT